MTEEHPAAPAESKKSGGPATVFAVPAGKRISLGAPSLLALANGKLLVAFDQTGPDVKDLGGKKGHDEKRKRWMQGRVMSSGDGGVTWKLAATFPFRRASLFRDGGDVYLLGEASGGLCLMRSPDGGASWSASMDLTGDVDLWLAPTTVLADGESWYVPGLVPVGGAMGLTVFRAPRGASLMNRKAWTQGPVSPPLAGFVPAVAGAGFGVPADGSPVLWRDPVLVKIQDARHPWHGAGALHVAGATGCGRQHWAAWLRLDAKELTLAVPRTPGGEPWCWLPLPGGHDKFDLFYDEPSHAHWLLGCRGSRGVPLGREASHEAGLRRIGAWTSENLMEWQFAGGVVAGGEGPAGIRCDPSGAVCGNDLAVACRAGGPGSRNARETTQVLCALLPNFRAKNG